MHEFIKECSSKNSNTGLQLILCSEWAVNQHRDSLSSYIGHHNLVEFFAIAENESKARVKFNFLQVNASQWLNPFINVYNALNSSENAATMWATS